MDNVIKSDQFPTWVFEIVFHGKSHIFIPH